MQAHEENVWKATLGIAEAYLAAEAGGACLDARTPEQLLAEVPFGLPEEGLALEDWVDRLKQVMAATPSSSSPRFVNQLFGGRIPEAVAADMLALLANSSMYTFKAAGAQVLVEQAVLGRLLTAAGMSGGEGSFVPGGSAANLAAMLMARNRAVPASRDSGMGGVRGTVYTSVESHYSIRKNAGILGLGRKHVRLIPVTGDGRMDVPALDAAIAADLRNGFVPVLVNATAGTTVRGAFDDIAATGAVAHKYGVWLHVDGALGATVLLSPKWQHLMEGLAAADSLAWNPHKMMGLALQTSVVLVREQGLLAGSLDETADYLFQSHADDFNPGHRSLLCGRRNDALRLWSAWCRIGDRGWEQRVDRQMALAAYAAERIRVGPQLALLEPPPLINVCFNRVGVPAEAVCTALDRYGEIKIGYGQVGETTGIRLVCANPEIGEAGIDVILEACLKVEV